MNCSSCDIKYDRSSNYCPNCGMKRDKIRKSDKIFIILIFVLSLILLLYPIGYSIVSMILYDVDEIPLNQFRSKVEELGCSVTNYQDVNYVDKIDYYYITENDNCPYLISYIKFNDDVEKKKFFDGLVDDVINNNGNRKYKSSIELIKYHDYVTMGDSYKSATMNDDIILYISTSSEYKDEIVKFKKDLGYEYTFNEIPFRTIRLSLFISILMILVSWWRLNIKMGRKGIACLIPIYNIVCLTKDIFGYKKYCLLLFIPIVNAIYVIMLLIRMARIFGKDDSYGVLSVLFPTLLLPMLAFDDSVYIKPIVK